MSYRKQHAGMSRLMVGVPLAAGLLAVTTMPTWAARGFQPPVTNVACSTSDLISKIAAANSATGPQILSLAPDCHYVLSTAISTPFGSSGTPAIAGGHAIGIIGDDATISRSSSAPSFRIFTVGPGAQLGLDSVKITGGLADCSAACPGNFAFGGGVGVFGGQLDVVKSKLIDNSATCGSSTGCTTAAGGAIGARNVTTQPAVVVITDSFLADNSAGCTDTTSSFHCTDAAGGALDATNGDVHVLRSTFHGNSVSCANSTGITTCANGDGGALLTSGSPGEDTVANSEFDHNSASSGGSAGGGAIEVFNAAATLSDNHIRHNSATSTGTGTNGSGGGGVLILNPSFTNFGHLISGGSVEQNTASSNATAAGGGIASAGDLSLAGVSIAGNTASASSSGKALGGGVSSDGGPVVVSLRGTRTSIENNTVTGGTALGGGVEAFGPLTLENGDVRGNTANGSAAAEGGGVFALARPGNTITASLVHERLSDNSATSPTLAHGGAIAVQNIQLLVQGGRVEDNQVTSSAPGGALGGGLFTQGGELGVVGKAQITENSARGPGAAGGGIFNSGGTDIVDTSSAVSGNRPDQCAPSNSVIGCS